MRPCLSKVVPTVWFWLVPVEVGEIQPELIAIVLEGLGCRLGLFRLQVPLHRREPSELSQCL